MGEVIQFNKLRMEKAYQQFGSLSINLALDEKKHGKTNRDIRHDYIKKYMKLLSK
jgi:hypothetical protein